MNYLAKRLLTTLPVLIGVTTLTFLLIHFVPGDPVDIMLGEQASTLDKAALRHELGLDQPVSRRYLAFVKGLATLDLGRSLQSKRPVSTEILERVPATVELAISAMVLAILVGVPLGVVAAVRKKSWLDWLIRSLALIGISTPGFWLGPFLVLLFSIQLDLLPVSDRGGFEHLILPSITLAFGLSSVLMQTTRAAMLETIHEEYVNVARAKGASSFRVYFKHALANALMPVITIIGLQSGALLTGAVIVETIYDWPGIGTLLFQAIQQRDYQLVQGCVLVIALIYVTVNLLTDLAYGVANPRVRLS